MDKHQPHEGALANSTLSGALDVFFKARVVVMDVKTLPADREWAKAWMKIAADRMNELTGGRRGHVD